MQEATIASLVDATAGGNNKDEADLTLIVELREKPAEGLPPLAARGSEDSVVPPKNSKAAASYHVTKGPRGNIVKRTPAPIPEDHEGFNFGEVYSQIDFSGTNSPYPTVSPLSGVADTRLLDVFFVYFFDVRGKGRGMAIYCRKEREESEIK